MKSFCSAVAFYLITFFLIGCSENLDDEASKGNELQTSLGSAFFEENGTRPNVVTTSSGLQYIVLKEGRGKKPYSSSTVVTHYQGEFVDGTIFDSSRQRGVPATFAVNGVIKGWTEALQLMSEGSHWRLFIPPHLAYGSRGAGGGLIPADAILIFDVELLEIK